MKLHSLLYQHTILQINLPVFFIEEIELLGKVGGFADGRQQTEVRIDGGMIQKFVIAEIGLSYVAG